MSKATAISSSMKDQEARWRAESDMDTLVRADEIRKDPKRWAAATALAKEKVIELASLAGESKEC